MGHRPCHDQNREKIGRNAHARGNGHLCLCPEEHRPSPDAESSPRGHGDSHRHGPLSYEACLLYLADRVTGHAVSEKNHVLATSDDHGLCAQCQILVMVNRSKLS